LLSTSKVQYVIKGGNFKKLGYKYNGKFSVLSQILSRGHLFKQLRVLGGAYGGYSVIKREGSMLFASYRDPNLEKTIENYDKAVDFLKDLKISQREMTRYIIGTISGKDRSSRSSYIKGMRAINRHFYNLKFETIQKERTEVLNTTIEDMKAMSKMVSDVMKENVLCIYGNEDKLKNSKGIFDKFVQVVE
ncbi:MAG: peptidase, partial [bacterium]|nr:peptidase [bacterium]